MATPTSNPIPSTAPQDLTFNLEKVDEIVNSASLTFIDRFGVSRLTAAGVQERLQTVAVTVDAITAVNATTLGLVDGDVIQARGTSSAADLLGGAYLYDADSVATVDVPDVVAPTAGPGRLLAIKTNYSGPGSTATASDIQTKLRRIIVDVADYFRPDLGDTDYLPAWNRAVALLNAGAVTALAVCGLAIVDGAIDPITRSGAAIYTFSGSGGTSGIRQLSATANTLTFTPTDPSAGRIDDTSIHNLAIWNGNAAPSAGTALTLIRAGRYRSSGLDIRNHFLGLDVVGGGDGHIVNSTIAGFYNWAAVATGSRCARFRIASYGAVNEVPSEWFITNFNWKGVTQTIAGPTNVNYLDMALEITAGDGLWFSNGHVGFSNATSCRIYQNAAAGYIADVEFAKVYFDGNRASDATTGTGADVAGASGNITGVRFLGCINKGHNSHGYNLTAPNAQRIQIIGGGIEANGRSGVVINTPVNTSVVGVDFANNNRLNTSSAAITVASSSGVRLLGNLIDVFATYPHPVGIAIGASCANVQVCDNTFDDAIANPMSFAACSTLTYRGNRLQNGNPTAYQGGAAILYLPTGFDTVLVPTSGGVSVTSIAGANNYGAEVKLLLDGSTTMVRGNNIGLTSGGGDFAGTAGSVLALLNNGTKWCEVSRAIQ